VKWPAVCTPLREDGVSNFLKRAWELSLGGSGYERDCLQESYREISLHDSLEGTDVGVLGDQVGGVLIG
jgi:hypothetical protein